MVTSRPWHNPGKWFISPLIVDVKKLKPEQPAQAYIKDETLREGEETPKVVFNNNDRIQIVRRLAEIGVAEITIPRSIARDERKELIDTMKSEGIPLTRVFMGSRHLFRDKWKEAMKGLVDDGATRLELSQRSPNPEGLEQMRGAPPTLEKCLEEIREMIRYASTLGVPITLAMGPVTQRKLEVLKAMCQTGVEAGADRVLLADSYGLGTPLIVRYMVSEIKKVIGEAKVNWHGHNDFGMTTANTVAAVEGGAEIVDCVINGLGDRAGNAPLEEVVSALEILCGVKTGVKMEKFYELSKWFQELTGVKLQPNKAVVGENAFLEEAASHYLECKAAEAMGTPESANPYAPELVGQKRSLLVGSTTLYGVALNYLLDFWKMKYTEDQADEIRRIAMKEVKAKKFIQEDELRSMCERVLKAGG